MIKYLIIGFLIGFFIGDFIGMAIMCILQVAKDGEE
ncbi:unknown [Clostridium sp. CAG:470]|nr:unknown [Clostridium sp. CAG:470]